MTTQRYQSAKWWQWPSALSLEAPAVALAWQDLLARSHGPALRLEGRCALGLTVWAVYLADRLIDIREPPGSGERVPHDFCRGHRALITLLLAMAIAGDAVLTLFWLRPQVALNGLLLAGAVAVYLLIFSWRRSFRLAKPWAAALLFTAGVFLVAWSRTPSPYASLAAYALVFFTLCLGNLLLPRLAAPVVFAMMMLAIFCAWQGEASRWFPAAAVGALGLAAVAFFGQRLPGEARALLADAALLIPALRLWTSTG